MLDNVMRSWSGGPPENACLILDSTRLAANLEESHSSDRILGCVELSENGNTLRPCITTNFDRFLSHQQMADKPVSGDARPITSPITHGVVLVCKIQSHDHDVGDRKAETHR